MSRKEVRSREDDDDKEINAFCSYLSMRVTSKQALVGAQRRGARPLIQCNSVPSKVPSRRHIMYKGSSRDLSQDVFPRDARENGRTEAEERKWEKKGVGDYWTKLPAEPTRLQRENYSLYKLILISLSLISLGAGDSKLAPYMFVFLITSWINCSTDYAYIVCRERLSVERSVFLAFSSDKATPSDHGVTEASRY